MTRRTLHLGLCTALVALTTIGSVTCAQDDDPLAYTERVPPEAQGVGVDEKLGDIIPMDLTFTDDQGREIRLGDYFTGDKPILLTPIFYECPMLCSLTLNGMVDALNDLEWSAGDEFDIVTFTIKPSEEQKLAAVKKKAYLTQYKRDSVKDGWHFLVGDEADINRLCEAIGFKFNVLDDGNIAHSASIVFLTPDGRIARYMNDVKFEPRDLRLALVESSEGTIGSPLEKFALFMCYQYDPEKGSYAWAAWKVMRLGGALTLCVIALALLVLLIRGPRNPLAEVTAEEMTAMGGSPT